MALQLSTEESLLLYQAHQFRLGRKGISADDVSDMQDTVSDYKVFLRVLSPTPPDSNFWKLVLFGIAVLLVTVVAILIMNSLLRHPYAPW